MPLNADILFEGGPIHTGLGTLPPGSALAVKHGRVLAVGKAAELRALAVAERVDLGGRCLIPGLIDAHNHLSWYAQLLRYVDCRLPLGSSLTVALERLRRRAEDTPPGEWVGGWGFADYKVSERRFPTLAEMDEAAPAHPAVMIHASGHSAVANRLALKTMGHTDQTPDPPGGRIERDPRTGRPNGVLHEAAMQGFSLATMFEEYLSLSVEEQVAILEQGSAEYARLGITTVCDPSVMPPLLTSYQEAERAGRLRCRVVGMPLYEWSRPILDSGMLSGFGSDRLKLGPVKLIGDGSLSGRTAAVTQPYLNADGLGILYHDQPQLDEIVRELDHGGQQIAIHAIGDRAVEQVLRAYEKVIVKGGSNRRRHRMEHAGIVNPELIRLMEKLDVVIATQPRMLFEQGDGFYRACGEERIEWVYPYRAYIEAGLHVAGSSDCPVVSPDPLLGMRDAVLRRTEEGRVLAPDQCLTPRQALTMFTRDAAYSLFEEKRSGTLEEGKLADLLVLSDDILCLPPEEWEMRLKVDMTVVDGEIVYRTDQRP